jgi:hypothetical protein
LQPLRAAYSRFDAWLKGTAESVLLAARIKGFLRDRIDSRQAEEKIRRDLAHRSEDFLRVAQAEIYAQRENPYRRLLENAGCDFSDLASHVRRHGLESTLERLAAEGVYLTAAEFRGKADVIRGALRFRASPTDFLRSDTSPGLAIQTGGSRNAPLRSFLSTERLAEQTHELAVLFAAHGLGECAHAIYDAPLPSSGGVKFLLIYAKMGVRVERWFAREMPANTRAAAWSHRWLTRAIVFAASRRDLPFPGPEATDLANIDRIVDWIHATQRRGMSCCVKSGAGSASRIAVAASAKGILLTGTRFLVGGEPLTEAKLETIGRAGAAAIPRYSFGEGGSVGLGCASPAYADEVHVSEHRLALVRRPRAPGALASIRPLLFTTFAPREVRFLFNVENGDYAESIERNCGCALERLGLKHHLYGIRSFEKLTSEGMNYFFGDLYELLEKILPGEFGGGPGSYQLVEEEDAAGQTRLSLVVDPAVTGLDEARLVRRVEAGLAAGNRWNRTTARLWANAGTFRIVRRPPHATARGKILPLHIARNKRAI